MEISPPSTSMGPHPQEVLYKMPPWAWVRMLTPRLTVQSSLAEDNSVVVDSQVPGAEPVVQS